jgi:hypothetical protein
MRDDLSVREDERTRGREDDWTTGRLNRTTEQQQMSLMVLG